MQLWVEGCVGGWPTRRWGRGKGHIDCEKFHWLANWLLPPDIWKVLLMPRRTHMHEIIFTHNKHKSLLVEPKHTQTHTNTHTYMCVCLIRRRSEPSTAQFRNFYGKSSLIKFNELWKRQQISRGQLCCKVCPRWYFLWVDVRRQRQATASTSTSTSTTLEKLEELAGASICVAVVNWRMWFLWVAGSIIKCGIKSVAHVEV